ncbi:SCO family protein [Baekduia soli]|uniref:SCO family protein n=1 Tax=Baekduia soli TaxID=496014 RepID=A0A5B8UAF4_9ACTN|nr:SCO family protein [Baekduia soli]QEC49964.1 SCO family protein [Baekduia soli]
MPARARLTLLLTASLVLVAALAIVVFAGSGGHERSGKGFEGSLRPEGIPPADFSLRDQDGRTVSLAAYRGRPVILTFMYSTCKDTCPLTAQQIRIAMDDLGHDVPALAVSVDPANDTELNAKRFLLQQHLSGRMRFLMGSRAQLQPIWKAYGIEPQGKKFDHSAYVLLIDARGVQRIGWPVSQLTPEGLAHDLRLLGAAA